MKCFKKVLTLVASLALVAAGFVQAPALKAEAADVTTWYITYDSSSDAWYGSSDGVNWSYPDLTKFQAGDKLVVNADGKCSKQITLNCPQTISELAFTGGSNAVVKAPYVTRAYAVNGSTGVVNSDVGTAEAYYTGVLQINGNVDKFIAYYDDSNKTVFAVTGTVNQANVKWTGDLLSNKTTVYNVKKGKLFTNEWGWVSLEEGDYSLTPTASTTTTTTTTTDSTASGKTLDDVPKTGAESGISESIIFFSLAAVFAIGAIVYKKKVQ